MEIYFWINIFWGFSIHIIIKYTKKKKAMSIHEHTNFSLLNYNLSLTILVIKNILYDKETT